MATSAPNIELLGTSNSKQEMDQILGLPVPIVAATITVLGALLMAYFVHRWNAGRERTARLAAASKEFRVAFADELAVLVSNREPYFDIQNFLLTAYDAKHRAAIALFEGFVPVADRMRFQAAWQEYHSGQRAGGEPLDMFDMGSPYKEAMFIEYSGAPFSHPTMGARELAIHRIRVLLAFAKHD